ncbi:MAG: DUF4433 domain-containing protein [Nitrospinae bacterium]|nr:DUF4433 domain-containing protein [Nitrospinota bacterium]
MTVSDSPKIYHIVHVDRLPSILSEECLWCDAEVINREITGTTIGMNNIKQRRLTMPLESYPNLNVGDCVPFYFCPRSVMLYLIHKGNHPELAYRDGQSHIIHLEADLQKTVLWAEDSQRRWAFTLSNAGSSYFEDRCNLTQLAEINWPSVRARDWRACKEEKQAEFLIEKSFPWELVQRIGVQNLQIHKQVITTLPKATPQPLVEFKPDWYY